MNTYKITNITNLVGKRDRKFNTVVDINYVDNRKQKTVKLKAGDTIYLSIDSLPLAIQRLRIKKLVDITEVDPKSVLKPSPKPVVKPVVKSTVKPTSKKKILKKVISKVESEIKKETDE